MGTLQSSTRTPPDTHSHTRTRALPLSVPFFIGVVVTEKMPVREPVKRRRGRRGANSSIEKKKKRKRRSGNVRFTLRKQSTRQEKEGAASEAFQEGVQQHMKPITHRERERGGGGGKEGRKEEEEGVKHHVRDEQRKRKRERRKLP